MIEKRKRNIHRRLAGAQTRVDTGKPTLTQEGMQVEIAERTRSVGSGGVALAHRVVLRSGLADAIDRHVNVLKFHRPYHESDHVLSIAYNILSGGQT